MLSFKDINNKGVPVAIIKGGKNNNKIIYIIDENNKNDDNNYLIDNNPLDNVDDVYNTNIKKMNRKQILNIKNALMKNNTTEDKTEYDIIINAQKLSKELSKKEFKIFDDGIIQPLPRFNKTERVFCAGQTECGKSYWCKMYLNQMVKVHPDKKIFLFSDVEEDPEIDDIKNLIRFKLDDDLAKKTSIDLSNFDNSICLFDDIDSIQNKLVFKFVQNLRDSILRRGRHNNISCIITSHLITNYGDTRIILNECNSIVLFCRSGSSYQIKYLLSKYVGLDKEQINKIMNLPSRWVKIQKNVPLYITYEKGIYLL
jgi:hypothetical protein